MGGAGGLGPVMGGGAERPGSDVELGERNRGAQLADIGGRSASVPRTVGNDAAAQPRLFEPQLLLYRLGEGHVALIPARSANALQFLLHQASQHLVADR